METDKKIAFWNTRLYKTWATMKQRCHNPNDHAYERYGGRGITVCEEWFNDYHQFSKWAKESGYSDDLTLDRIDNNKGYFPGNCRWATYQDQARNRRNTRLATLNGETHDLSTWADITGIERNAIYQRIYRGWSDEAALTTPIQMQFSRGKAK